MTQEERDKLLNKDIAELTPEDLEKIEQIMKDTEKEAYQALQELREAAAGIANYAVLSTTINLIKELGNEGAKEGVKAIFKAFKEYSSAHNGKVHDFFTDPELPEVLHEIRARANSFLTEKIGQSGTELLNEVGTARPLVEDIVTSEMLQKGKFYPTYNGELIREFKKLEKADFSELEYGDGSILSADTPKGPLRLISPDEVTTKFIESFGPMALKLFVMGLSELARKNYYDKSPAKNLRVDIELKAFAETQHREIEAREGGSETEARKARDRRRDFINEINRNLTDLSHFSWQMQSRNGYKKIGILQTSHRVENGIITFYFDQEFADNVRLDGIMMQSPTALLYTDNKDPNAYKIGLYIADHHGNDRNAARGTESTLSVKSIIGASTIPTFEELRNQGRRDWKVKIKRPLERSFNDFLAVEYWSRWQYRHPRTGKTYTPQKAEELSVATYEELMVDYVVKNAPDMTERRERREQERREREQRRAEAGVQPKKRGRPKKSV